MAENNDSIDDAAKKAATSKVASQKSESVKAEAQVSGPDMSKLDSTKPVSEASELSGKEAPVAETPASPRIPAKVAARPAKKKVRKTPAAKASVTKAESKTASIKTAASSKPTSNSQSPKSQPPKSQPPKSQPKEKTMEFSPKFAAGFTDAIAEAQDKAKEAFEKGSTMVGECSEFAKGNVEAMVESGQILAAGLQDMSTNLVAEGRSAFESISGDLKALAGAKSPTDLLKLQSEMMRKHFDTAVAYSSQNSEAMLKLASETMAPLTSRISVAVEKVRQAN